jgi:hypothetical protein
MPIGIAPHCRLSALHYIMRQRGEQSSGWPSQGWLVKANWSPSLAIGGSAGVLTPSAGARKLILKFGHALVALREVECADVRDLISG